MNIIEGPQVCRIYVKFDNSFNGLIYIVFLASKHKEQLSDR
jgi:hypothetical protein